jgi:hypothetical protein
VEVSTILRRLVLALLLLLAPAVYAADDGPYLFDLLKQPAYLSAWKAMLAGESVPSWVGKYAKTFDGPSSPSKTVTVGGQAYTLGWVCKAAWIKRLEDTLKERAQRLEAARAAG